MHGPYGPGPWTWSRTDDVNGARLAVEHVPPSLVVRHTTAPPELAPVERRQHANLLALRSDSHSYPPAAGVAYPPGVRLAGPGSVAYRSAAISRPCAASAHMTTTFTAMRTMAHTG
jgi:hypothetical protein